MTALVAHKYMPEQMPDAELRATFTARRHTLDFLVKALRDQIGSQTLTSYLVTGPRGSGKTTLVLMLCLRLREDAELAAAWLPVRFPEELPAITSLRDFFAAALSVLAEQGIDSARVWHERVEREPDERRSRDMAVTALRRLAEESGRRLIFIVENFDQLFERAWAKEEATLRRLLMVDPFMLVVGTTVRQFEALRAYGRAFFNYFCEVPLKRLDDEQVRTLLVSRAEWDGRPDVAERYRAHQADIRAICRLTGGNARLTVMLYEILSHGDIKSVVGTLRQLVDQLTPLLKDVLEHQLTDQQRKVIDALMRAGGTATPRALAAVTRLSLNTVTTQLQRLKEAEVVDVQGGGKGRPAYYFMPDQLFCTWYQMRYLHPHRRRIEMFLEVLRTWFKAEERLEMVKSVVGTASDFHGGSLVSAAVVAEYYAASLAQTEHGRDASDLAVGMWLKTGNLQEAAFALAELRDVRGNDRRSYEAIAYAGLGNWAEKHGDVAIAIQALRIAVERDPANWKARLRYGAALLEQRAHGPALECFEDVIHVVTDPHAKSLALITLGLLHEEQGDTSKAIADYTAVVELEGALREQVARALIRRGITREEQGDRLGAIADYTEAINLEGTPLDDMARALVNRGLVRKQQGDFTEGIADFTAVIELAGISLEDMASALFNRGVARAEQGDASAAIADYTALVELEGAPQEQKAGALLNRGIIRNLQGDLTRAIADSTAVVELGGALRRDVTLALVNRGVVRGRQGNLEEAVSDYTMAVDLEGAPRAAVEVALIYRGGTRLRQGNMSGAIADFTAALGVDDASCECAAMALLGRAVARAEQGDTGGAIADYTALVAMKGVSRELMTTALDNRATARAQQGDTGGAIADYTALVALKGAPRELVATALVNRGVARGQQGDTAGAIADYTAVVELKGASREHVATALVNRGLIRQSQGDTSGAIADYTAVVELEGALREEVARALFDRGVAREEQGDASAAIADYTAVVELEGAPRERVAMALVHRGFTRAQQGDVPGAIADYTAVVEMEGAPREQVATALVNRGADRAGQGDMPGAIADYTAMVELEGAPREQVATALANRGVSWEQYGDVPRAIADYTAVVELEGAPREQVARALFNRGITRQRQGDMRRAFADFTAVVELEGAPREQVEWAFVKRGIVRGRQGDTSGEIVDYTTVVELEGASRKAVVVALANRGIARGRQGDAPGAIRDLTVTVNLPEIPPDIQAAALISRGQAYVDLGQPTQAFEDAISVVGNTACAAPLRIFAVAAAARVSPSDPHRVERVCSDAKAFVTSLPPEEQRKCIVELLSRLASPETASVWLRLWRTTGWEPPENALSSLAFLDAVAGVLEGHDRSILNPLPPEQREFAEDILRMLQPPTDAGPGGGASVRPTRE